MRAKLSYIPILAAALLAWSMPLSATYLYCSKPIPPSCLDQFGEFDEWSFRQCRNAVESFVQEVQQFQQCVIYEAERINSEARQEADQAVERFNCRAQGDSFC